MKKHKVYTGTSGFSYKHWFGDVFYPDEVNEPLLTYYSRYFNTVELNVTFYRLPKKSDFKKWADETPADFVFAVKGSRFITHIKRLKADAAALKKFFDAAAGLGSKFKVVLWQLPASFKKDTQRLESFAVLLGKYPKVRHAFEFRDKSWLDKDVYRILTRNKMALVIVDSTKWPTARVVTTDFVYIRFHGGKVTYASKYQNSEIKSFRRSIKKWSESRDVYGYFNNDAYGFAVGNAMKLQEMLLGSLYTKR